ncbi:hypothetical protein YC2023_030533 [Brassica napus]
MFNLSVESKTVDMDIVTLFATVYREASFTRSAEGLKRRAKKAESDAATIEPTTGKATVAEEVPGAGAGDSMVAAVAELTNTAETKRATKKLLTFLISIIIIIIIYLFILDDGFVCVFYLMP